MEMDRDSQTKIFQDVSGFHYCLYLHGRANDEQKTEMGGGWISKLINAFRKVFCYCVEGEK